MNPNREEALFALALEKPAAERAAFLDAVCGGDQPLRRRLETLLAAHVQPDAALATAAPNIKATMKIEIADAPDEAVGQTLGRYKLLERLGEGGCGVVYVAEQTEPVRRRVALKVIKLGMDTKQVVARFEAERQALAMMDHPNIAKVLDAGTTEKGRPYFVMELVRGIRITDYCDQANLSTKDRLDLFIKVCHAIQHAHQKGIIHRDIKPSNILVTLHDGVPVPKVIDFGIAKATEGRLTDNTVYTQLHQFIGTPAYMSPEQAEMSGLDIDTRSDIYSLGVLLYELLTGRTPFDAKELMSLGIDAMRKTIREKEPARPSTKLATLQGDELTTTAKRRSVETSKLANLLRGDLDWIVMKCLEKDRARRYETANGLAADLKRHLNNEVVVARPPTVAYRFQKSFRRNKLVFTAATAVAVVLLIGIAVSTWQTFAARKAQRETEVARTDEQQQRLEAQKKQAEAEAERQRADAEARKATESQKQSRRLLYASDMNLAQQALKLNNLGRARRLLDRHLPQPGEDDLRGWEWRYLWQLTRSSALVTLTNRETRGFSVSFSPDGSRLAVGWYDGHVDLWDVRSRTMVRALTPRAFSGYPGHVAFSPVGNLLAATSGTNVVTLYDFDSGRESVLWRATDQGSVRDLAFSKDGSKVVVYAGSRRTAGDEVAVVNVSSSSIESRHPTGVTGSHHHGAARLSPDNRFLYLANCDPTHYRYSIRCIDLATGNELWQTEPQRDYGLTALDVSPDGRFLASGSGFEDPTIRIWDAATGRLVVRLDGHTSWVGKLVFTPDGRRLISAAADQSIRFWDTSTWTEIQVLRGHSDEVHAVAISESADLIASAGKDGNLMLWKSDAASATDGYRHLPENLSGGQVVSLGYSRLLLLPRGKPLELLDLKRDSPPRPLSEIGNPTNYLNCFDTNLICCWDGTNRIVLFELKDEKLVQRGSLAMDSGTRPTGFDYNVAHHLMAWTEGTSSNSVYLADLATPGRRTELKSDVPGLLNPYFTEDGKLLAAFGRRFDFIRVWNIETGKVVASIKERFSTWNFAAGGRVLVLVINKGNDNEVVFYDLAHPDAPPRRVLGKDVASGLAVSPDGRLVASSTHGALVRLFDPVKGELIESLHGHLNAAFGVAFSLDGRRLVAAGAAREAIKLWDVGTRQELLTLAEPAHS